MEFYHELYVLLILSVSWFSFYWLGKMFFNRSFSIQSTSSSRDTDYRFQYMHTNKYQEYYHTMYASTHSLSIGKPTRALFLSVFVVSCTLLELICLDILQVVKPDSLSQLIWKIHLFALCLIMNVLTPFVFVKELCNVMYNLSSTQSTGLAALSIMVIQFLMWSTHDVPYFPLFNGQLTVMEWTQSLFWSFFDISNSVTRY
jgi:hypothetical protein